MGYKTYLAISLISIAALLVILLTGIDFRNKGVLGGIAIGAGLRSMYEFFKEQKQNSGKRVSENGKEINIR